MKGKIIALALLFSFLQASFVSAQGMPLFSDPAITLLFALLVVTAFVFIMFIFVATSPRKPKAPP
ncbi:hypothetical protein J4475_00465, partial [Candidatus Woesearchaeota archaeon]|nr:hypothetical protein [Candidatus Woesearchaeota archaeon]